MPRARSGPVTGVPGPFRERPVSAGEGMEHTRDARRKTRGKADTAFPTAGAGLEHRLRPERAPEVGGAWACPLAGAAIADRSRAGRAGPAGAVRRPVRRPEVGVSVRRGRVRGRGRGAVAASQAAAAPEEPEEGSAASVRRRPGARPRMEGPVECGARDQAELEQPVGGALGGTPEQRASGRLREPGHSAADPADPSDPADEAPSAPPGRRPRGGPAEEGARPEVPGDAPRPGRPAPREAAGSSPQLRRGPGGADGAAAEEEGAGALTLDPLEHAWMLSAADGRWDSLEGLLACEPGLLAKRDFITGFTCLHWAAKHGRQELLALLVRFAGQHRLPVNINARTSGGYTALHLAAMHGHVEVVKLLVGAYDADVDVRDYSGKKPSQYLSPSTAEEIRTLVGALDEDEAESTAGSGGGRWRLSRVLPSTLISGRLSHALEDGGDHHHHHHHLAEGLAAGKAKEPGRKASGSSSGRMKPRLNKIRFRTQIIHTTPSFRDPEQPLEEGEDEEEDRSFKGHSSSFKLRPKSNVFG
ncbi:ankyrin repeat domain-containing protein SOWAHC [Phocoena sinus]|nr:ankyrin repeat domain-containing protein SOWAHC [Phocoena sinus]